jgi:hypothetical protein
MIGIFIALLTATIVSGGCDNRCSGHGTCECGECQCFDNWGLGSSYENGDCSDRICPFERSWIDFPDSSGNRHKYLECAGQGICDRTTGECDCFPGYEGKGCQRSSCPNNCTGHGRCKYIEDMRYGVVEFDHPHYEFTQSLQHFYYFGWDERKMRGCECDPGYSEYDCSKRMCPHGNDVMSYADDELTTSLRYQTQRIRFSAPPADSLTALTGKTYALTFKSKLNETFTTIPLYFDATDLAGMELSIESNLKKLPNRVIESVDVTVTKDAGDSELIIQIELNGESTQGTQNLITVEDYSCGAGCTPLITGLQLEAATGNVTEVVEAHYNSYECGRRGKCDYDTGVCSCFEGFTGPSCSTQTSLR